MSRSYLFLKLLDHYDAKQVERIIGRAVYNAGLGSEARRALRKERIEIIAGAVIGVGAVIGLIFLIALAGGHFQ